MNYLSVWLRFWRNFLMPKEQFELYKSKCKILTNSSCVFLHQILNHFKKRKFKVLKT